MKKTAFFLIIFGMLAELITYALYNRYLTSGGMIIPQPLHTINFELIVSVIGVLILWLASVQQAKHLRFATTQIVCGLLISVLPLIYAYISLVWPLFIVMAAALAIVVSGLIQLFFVLKQNTEVLEK